MKIIKGPAGCGKTTKAIKIANERDAYLAVRSKKRANQVYHSDEYPDLDRFPITYDDMINRHIHTSTCGGVVIDNVDEFLRQKIQTDIQAVTMRTDE